MGGEGKEGNNDKIAFLLGYRKSSVNCYVKRVRIALLKLKDKIIVWPDEKEKDRIKSFIKFHYGFQKCIGIIDGTLIVLHNRPYKYGDSYWCRKNCYVLNVQIICDERGRVIYVYGSWPGSTHDNRAWRNSKVFLDAPDFFSNGEYLLGDSAYSACRYIIQSFKKVASADKLDHDEEFFHTKLSSIRVKSEHCIRILKNRFPILKRISTTIKGRKSVKQVMDLVECITILHNLLLDFEDDMLKEWIEELEEGHYWTNDNEGGCNTHANGNTNYDCRQ